MLEALLLTIGLAWRKSVPASLTWIGLLTYFEKLAFSYTRAPMLDYIATTAMYIHASAVNA